MDTKPGGQSLEDIRGIIRGAGLRSTGPRVAVLGHLLDASTPLSHGEIADALAEDGFDRATIYRNLSDLTEVNLVMRADRGDHAWRFEVRRQNPEHTGCHPHFVCTDCGLVSCLPDSTLPGVSPTLSIGQVSEVVLKGRCNACL